MPTTGYITLDNRNILLNPPPGSDPQKRFNSYSCPRGKYPGHGRLLMLRSDVALLNFNIAHTIRFVQSGDSNVTLTLQNMWLLKAYRLAMPNGMSGPRNDASAPYVVEFVDRRHLLCKFGPLGVKTYNVRDRLCSSTSAGSNGTNYLSAPICPETWNSMCQNIWRTVGGWNGSKNVYSEFLPESQDWPGLPYSPNDKPQNWLFYGENGWLALHKILERLDCDVVYNPVTDLFSIIRFGTTQSDWSLVQNQPYFYDGDEFSSVAARVPRSVKTAHHVFQPEPALIIDNTIDDNVNRIQGNFTDLMTLSGATAAGTGIDNSILLHSEVYIWDDMPYETALNSTSSGFNDTIRARTQERASNHQTRCLISEAPSLFGMPGIVTLCIPGSEIDLVAWRFNPVADAYETWLSSNMHNDTPWNPEREFRPPGEEYKEQVGRPNFNPTGWDLLWPRQSAMVQAGPYSEYSNIDSGVNGIYLGATLIIDTSNVLTTTGDITKLHNDAVVTAGGGDCWFVFGDRQGRILSNYFDQPGGRGVDSNAGIYLGILMGMWKSHNNGRVLPLYFVQADAGDKLETIGAGYYVDRDPPGSAGSVTVLTDLVGGTATLYLTRLRYLPKDWIA